MHSQYLDVPQKRERLVLLAVRKDLGFSIIVSERERLIQFQ
jgi:site-specific DNA-cytosine methylase